MKKTVILFFLVAGFLSSCDEDFFSTTLEVDPPEYEDRMVVSLFASNLDQSIACRLGQTIPILEDKDFEESMINGAAVMLYHEERVICELANDPAIDEVNNYFGTLMTDLVADQWYELEVQHPKYGAISARQQMPATVDIDSVIVKENGGLDSYGDRVSSLDIKITDPPSVKNYYGMAVVIADTSQGRFYEVDVWSDDPQLQDGFMYNGLITADSGFDGHEYTFRLFFNPWVFQDVKAHGYLVWRQLSEDHYLYTKSLQRWYDSDDFAGFSEPTIVHSNIDGGLGCFGLFNVQYSALPR